MPSNKETLFQDHICSFLAREHGYEELDSSKVDPYHHIAEEYVLNFIKGTQYEAYQNLYENYGVDSDGEIIKELYAQLKNKPLWVLMRHGLEVRGVMFSLYKPSPRSQTSQSAQAHYNANQFHYRKEYRYNPETAERIDLVIWLNGLPIIVTELKHEDEGQNVNDAIHGSFLNRSLRNRIYKYPFLYVASSDCEVKVATNPEDEKNFRWFNAQLRNQAETEGEYPVEHLYRHAFSPQSICQYLEHFLVQVPTTQVIDETGQTHTKQGFTIFPRYHQIRASLKIARKVLESVNDTGELGLKYLVNHSAGSGKTLTIAWLADQLDSLYDDKNQKVFDNVVILTDRKSLDKNVRDDLDHFTHLKSKVYFAKRSRDLAKHLDDDRDIIVTTIHKFGYIQEKLKDADGLEGRKIAFLIDEAHRSQEGKMALTMRQMFTSDGGQEEKGDQEEESQDTADDLGAKIQGLNISNQIFVAFTATTTPKTVDYFGEPVDLYSEREAIEEGYILDVAQSIISYQTLYHISKTGNLVNDQEYPAGVLSKALKLMAFKDDALIQYKSAVMIKLFMDRVDQSIGGLGKAMIVASSRPAGLIYLKTIKQIIEDKGLPFKALYAFSDYSDPDTKEEIKEDVVNELTATHGGKLIEDVFDQDEYRILIVANKFQTGFDQPLLSAMFLDKVVKGVTAIQTVSRLNRKHPDKEQDDILVVDFTNNSEEIFKAFNKHREGSPYEEHEPDPSQLQELYDQVIDQKVFTLEEIKRYVDAYIKADESAQRRESEMDALLSDITQEYRGVFERELQSVDDRKAFVSLLRRYSKLYYFIAKFFELPQELHEFIIFVDGLVDRLINKGKTSKISMLMKHLQVSKGAVTCVGESKNTTSSVVSGGGGGGAPEIPLTSIEEALQKIREKYEISDDDAIIIREICDEVAEKEDIQQRVIENKENEQFLSRFEPDIQNEIKNSYISRNLWGHLENPMYVDAGGIITIMGKTVIEKICA